ncbi:HEPN domain-containing protein [Agrobacterium larrymoorei]|uniref:HEPN domain-containing protein n=2 Tax=Agrobacterium larrymoorei TaxID=160699 RepID=A0A4D7DW09_9HYPH|nr:HEPN domain-containing protein [Agrobacterium larrymoorei]
MAWFWMSAELHIANALRLAHEDLEAAEMLAAKGNRYDAYHAQQAAEKILIALLTSEGIRAERRDSHRIDVLRDLLPDTNSFKSRFATLTFLTVYATTYRYPKDAGRLPSKADEADLLPAMKALREVLSDASTHFGVDLSASDRIPAASIRPPRT